jgi:hypothetical protein
MPMTRSVIDATTEFLSAPTSGIGLERAVVAANKAQVRVVLPWLMSKQDNTIRLEHNAVSHSPEALHALPAEALVGASLHKPSLSAKEDLQLPLGAAGYEQFVADRV